MKAQTYRKAAAVHGRKAGRKTEICKEKLAAVSDLFITGTAAYNHF